MISPYKPNPKGNFVEGGEEEEKDGRERKEEKRKELQGGTWRPAHGDHHTRLPPPPDPSQLDALPFKLRKLFSFSNPDHRKDEAHGGGGQEKKRKRGCGGGAEEGKLQKRPSKDDDDDHVKFKGEDRDEARDDENKKKKKKRKRGQVEDLRFEALVGGAKYGDKRRERKKKFLEAKKKKQKKKGANAEEESEFPGWERITFGEVVHAPPKLLSIPKATKNKVLQSAYKERLRLEVIDVYRQQRGWTNRPGLKLPSLDLTPAL